MKNCYLCHTPVDPNPHVSIQLSWTETNIRGEDPETVKEYIHRDCLEHAERSFSVTASAGKF